VVSPFVIGALRVSPETRKAQPELTDWAWLWFVAVTKTACLFQLMDLTSFLFLRFGSKDF
jgi:hypothetical protein